ncbi:MAG: GDP-mannose 4,6-dehydratase [Ignavibacteria bacterium GWB2_35_12]|nr:MAG: GDP-mannose 4,6-dehydratase [Ignavibacteria bacterium GWA2_35_8]OGU41451.1 MAG: GDP-mannose 4,6-dehydratase [Ignavibacteria bacterium GWB2_35_12]OGU94985.1 MAG: GDP-mannose 4,6-dehydratase [Ignavibacteria bacterium RIFOXYA2_FULL_35_10]OGV19372.1 MAG: GDP-mannose 4,6-dehydratase [Ignavibacteria bacterium RIFOXYC2_FULL_35_21]
MSSKKALITGITGQDGSYLSRLLLEKGYEVIGLTRGLSESSTKNMKYLGIDSQIQLDVCDLTDLSNVIHVLQKYQPSEVYNLAAQSSVGKSFEQPIGTISFNIVSVLNLLESIKIVDKNIKFYQASTSEMYGKVEDLPINEESRIHPLSPYAVSKASAHWITVNYRESYGIKAWCGILFNHESYLRTKNYFVKKVITSSIEITNNKRKTLKVGNIDIKRDFGYSPDYVEAMWLMLQMNQPDDYVVCSGKSISLREIIEYVFNKFSIPMSKLELDYNLYRPTDIQDIYGDNTKAVQKLGWKYDKSFFQILDLLIEEELKNYS